MRRPRWPAYVLGVVGVLAVLLAAASQLEGTLTFYKTPTELAASPSASVVRVGGLVVEGSVHRHGGVISFVLTDGADDLKVRSTIQPPGTFRGGQGAVVEGKLGEDGVFVASSVVVRHSNQYRAPGDVDP
jgi:cytochrome c-type biogenesis protein CcmE